MIYAQIDVLWKGEDVIKDVGVASSRVLEGAAIQVVIQAQRHVQPGIGPGRHPHPGRIDTGNLMRDIQAGDEYREGNALVREVGNNEATYYGSILEAGWTTSLGNYFRYPWLWPALEVRVGDIRRMVSGMKL